MSSVDRMSAQDDPHPESPPPIRPRSLALLGAGADGEPGGAQSPPPRLWRSLEERDRDPTLLREAAAEFPPGASELDGVSRRNFIQLLGTSAALTGAACYRPNQKIVPYVRRPPEVTPGNPLHFASAHALEGYARGLIVESHEGRPIKVEGNPDHPDSLGTTTVFDQALPLGLYDSERGTAIRHQGRGLSWGGLLKLVSEHVTRLSDGQGAKLRFLVEPSGSPLLANLRARILEKLPAAKFVPYSSVAADGLVAGSQLAFGRPLEPRHDLTRARVILALDADFLTEGPEQLRLSRQYAAGREPGPNMSRLYVAEPCPTSTGTMADHRLRVRGSDVLALARALAVELGKDPSGASLGGFASLPAGGANIDAAWVRAVAKDLLAHRGQSVVIAGRRQPAAVHALAHAMNVALGNLGTTVSLWAARAPDPLAGMGPLGALVEEIAAGQVDTLVITAENPVYTAPADFKLGALLQRVPNVIYMGLTEDETAAVAGTYVPRAHVLESWGDGQGLDGTVSIVQPLIMPLWRAHGASELLAAFVGEGEKSPHLLLKEFWQKRATAEGRATAATFEATWEAWLAKGVVDNTAGQAESVPAPTPDALTGRVAGALQTLPQGGGLEVGFVPDAKVFDGRFANNAWLQELPHPITKMTWDNAVLLSNQTADRLGVKTGDVVEVSLGDRKVEGPVFVQVGHADEAITLALGYGRKVGKVAAGVGFDAGLLRDSRAPWYALGAEIRKTGGRHRFGITQVHWTMEDRDPVRQASLGELLAKDSKFHHDIEHHRGELPVIHEPVDYSKQPYKWAMSIDLNKCTGCSVCVVACQSENNIPVVGRDNVRIGREMQWLRIDRYYTDADDPQMLTQPVACVHCETAPCEYVCPVNATTHSDEGLNEMVYNRCVGTRYCSNNCPYKARRFNFLDYHAAPTAVEKMRANPDVTVRSRGIMEKCTYCVQRIERARIDASIEGRRIREGEIITACQQACPTHAIEFGSLHDPNAQVAKDHQDGRRYDLLHEIGTRPRTAYLARVRNPNPELG